MLASPVSMPFEQTSYVSFLSPLPFQPLGTPTCSAAQVKFVVGTPRMPMHHHRSQTFDTSRSHHNNRHDPSSKPARRSTCPAPGASSQQKYSMNRSQSFTLPPTSYYLPSPYSPEEVRITSSSAPCLTVPFPQPHLYPSSSFHPQVHGNSHQRPPARTNGSGHPGAPFGSPNDPGIISDDIRLDLVGCDVLVRAVKEIEDCAAIFSNWVEQIDIRDTGKGDKYERRIVELVYEINNDGVSMVGASHTILRTHQALAKLVKRRLELLALSGGGDLFPSANRSPSQPHSRHQSKRNKPDDFRLLAAEIKIQSAEISSYVRQMYEKLSQLVDDINTVKGEYRMKKKVWNWLCKIFSTISTALKVTNFVNMFHPLGPIAAPITSACETVASIAAKVSEKIREGYDTKRLEELLVYIKREIPRSVDLARRALTSFESDLLRVFEAVDRGEASGWISASEAARASKNWRQALARLEARDSTHQPMFDVTIRSH